MDGIERANTRQQQNRQAFPELTPFVDALNAALAAHGSAPARMTYLYRPGLEIGRPTDLSQAVHPTIYNGLLANGSEFVKKARRDK